MKKYLVLSLLAVIVMLYSCNKDKNSTSNTSGIQGSYKLKYLTAKTNSTLTATDGEKSVTISNYTTINNGGTIVFDNSNLTATGLTYEVDTVAMNYDYQDNVLIDSSSFPFTFTLPPSSSTGAYQLVGADSIYFPQGSLTSGVGGSGTIQSGAGGGRYTVAGNLLTITQNGSKDSTFEESGETIHMTESAISSVVMEKQ